MRDDFDRGRFRRDERCGFFPPLDAVTQSVGEVMCGELGYWRDTVEVPETLRRPGRDGRRPIR